VLGEQRLELVVHLLEDAFILHYCKVELSDGFLLLAVLHEVKVLTASHLGKTLELTWLLEKLSLQLLQLFQINAVQELLLVI